MQILQMLEVDFKQTDKQHSVIKYQLKQLKLRIWIPACKLKRNWTSNMETT